jgi:hypothetical protein
MYCHNSRVDPDKVNDIPVPYGFPHENPAAELLMGTGGVGDENIGDSGHTNKAFCVDCHMGETPDKGKPGHTFAVAVENIGVCNGPECHSNPPLISFNPTAAQDYDGDSTTEGIQDEVQGLLDDTLLTKIRDSGVKTLSYWPYFSNITTEAQKKAIFNYLLVKNDGSKGIHNPDYTIGLLQATILDLSN